MPALFPSLVSPIKQQGGKLLVEPHYGLQAPATAAADPPDPDPASKS